jgi:hypothetical protein
MSSKASALQFLFREGKKQNVHRIPKTIVFFDSKEEAHTARQRCCKWLHTNNVFGYSKTQARETIVIFHRDTADEDKNMYLQDFRRLDKVSAI